ncbi:hypothetical protein [Parapedobacter tibetensis]|uniref:hypothetical protein n=1 Tax=Parapedobacter tibetensis TaxID=2972951 RepID=UPI00214DC41B|nr:hypothetical protein [Parapedobacter tibetensis]
METSIITRLLPIALCAMFVVSSCRNESKDAASDEKLADIPTEGVEVPIPSLPYIAVFDDESEQLTAETNSDFDRSLLSVDALTETLLTNYPEIQLEIDKVSNDTLYVKIPGAQYLTQQMGSSGAQMYLLEATYAYTELPNIHVINFSFIEGDHARPGAYTRKSFDQENLAR